MKRHLGKHMMLNVEIHIPVQHAKHWIDDHGTCGVAMVFNVLRHSKMLCREDNAMRRRPKCSWQDEHHNGHP